MKPGAGTRIGAGAAAWEILWPARGGRSPLAAPPSSALLGPPGRIRPTFGRTFGPHNPMKTRAKRSEATPRIGHLDSLSGILHEMASIYREMRHGSTPPDVGSRLIWALSAMRGVLETIALERIEARLAEIEQGHGGTREEFQA
jgi:hypothetical protein